MGNKNYKWCDSEEEAIAHAIKQNLEHHWMESKGMWLVCSSEDWNAVLRGDITIC